MNPNESDQEKAIRYLVEKKIIDNLFGFSVWIPTILKEHKDNNSYGLSNISTKKVEVFDKHNNSVDFELFSSNLNSTNFQIGYICDDQTYRNLSHYVFFLNEKLVLNVKHNFSLATMENFGFVVDEFHYTKEFEELTKSLNSIGNKMSKDKFQRSQSKEQEKNRGKISFDED